MSFGTAIKTCFGKLFVFSGRARRSEFWWFYLFVNLVSLAVSVVVVGLTVWLMLGPMAPRVDPATDEVSEDAIVAFIWALLLLYGALVVVGLALTAMVLGVQARRLHDTGQSGHWLWFYVAGLGIVPLIMCIMEGQPHPNQYGPDPKAPPAYGV